MAKPALPPPPERDPNTIDSIKRTLCAALLIWVSTPPVERPRVKWKVTVTLVSTILLIGAAGWRLTTLTAMGF